MYLCIHIDIYTHVGPRGYMFKQWKINLLVQQIIVSTSCSLHLYIVYIHVHVSVHWYKLSYLGASIPGANNPTMPLSMQTLLININPGPSVPL